MGTLSYPTLFVRGPSARFTRMVAVDQRSLFTRLLCFGRQ
jgi:hypothetical protein